MVLKYGHFYSRSSNFALILVLMLKNFIKFQLQGPPFHDKISSKDNTFTTKSVSKPLRSEIRAAHLYPEKTKQNKNKQKNKQNKTKTNKKKTNKTKQKTIQCLLQGQPVFNRFWNISAIQFSPYLNIPASKWTWHMHVHRLK